MFELLSKSYPSKPKDSDKIKVRTLEMEALTAVRVALLTVYDMCKAVDRGMVMSDVKLLEKSGDKSGEWKATESLARSVLKLIYQLYILLAVIWLAN